MSFKVRINNIRRKLMNNITKNVGRSYAEPQRGELKIEDVEKVLIIRPNHRLGNQILLTAVVQEVLNTFPYCKIDLFVKGGIAHPVFQNYDRIDKIIKLPRKPFNHLFKYAKCWVSVSSRKYDIVINGDKNSSSGRLLTNKARGKLKIFGDTIPELESKFSDYNHISKYPTYNLRYSLNKLGVKIPKKALPNLDIKLNGDELEKGKTLLEGLNKNSNRTICIFTNATRDKCYSESWWLIFYNRMLKEFPNYNIIEMLPVENISKINFKAPSFYSEDIREMGGVLKNTSVFIAADNGIMHLASASQVPTIGFFSVTDPIIYGPYGNGSMALDTNKTNMEDWIDTIKGILN